VRGAGDLVVAGTGGRTARAILSVLDRLSAQRNVGASHCPVV
jgi:hypothetical protein